MNNILSYNRTNTIPSFAGGQVWSDMSRRKPNFAHGERDSRVEQNPASPAKVILVPLTLSGSCRAALAVARNLAREIKARLLLLHIVQLNIAGEERGIQRTRLVNELCRIAENQLQQLADRMGGQITTEVLVCEGRPAEAIVAAAKHLRAEMIIMRTNGHRGWRRWLHRNTALHVMRQSGCKTCLVLSGKRDTAANMIIVDHTTINPLPKDVFSRENTNPLRSLARVLFS